ncbi:MAG: hypothetical protein K2X87_19905 [Gemmataceae bacterium]|nr:hypothetical protein [Gemmataceae bacterium]
MQTQVNGVGPTVPLPAAPDTYTQTLSGGLVVADGVTSIVIDACPTVHKRDTAAVGANLPTVGSIRVILGGDVATPPSYYDSALTPGVIPVSTDVALDTVTFTADPGWVTGDAIRVIANYGAPSTGLVTPPGSSGPAATSSTYYARSLGGGTYSFYATYAGAQAGGATDRVNITAAVPANGSVVILGQNTALGFLGHVPVNPSLTPASTDFTTTETVTFAAPHGWASGTPVRVSATGGGLALGSNYFVRALSRPRSSCTAPPPRPPGSEPPAG